MKIGYFNDGLQVNCKTTPISSENSQAAYRDGLRGFLPSAPHLRKYPEAVLYYNGQTSTVS